ncbi:PEP-CTERM sorting domain-containing protein [Methylotenera sp. 1P/1]|uniref:PEP-CTERM sorting domain-containing protein n=1 Tax=Methylotenera sp. 1P/1 TaxID=1131551 RepID=UPI00037BA5D0|nr:PEP-CTERM sorting domain-containing protein [Methylotenera sp. 1P/1]
MKKLLLALTIALSATAAQAEVVNHLALSTAGSVTFTTEAAGYTQGHNVITGATGGVFGQLSATQDTALTVTFLGKEAWNVNFYIANGSEVAGTSTSVVNVGDSFTFNVAAGLIDFGFGGSSTSAAASNLTNYIGKIAYIENDGSYKDANGNPFAFLIGFNDSGSPDGDYDDYVVGVSAVPVPAALPLLASALGMFGVARRRKTLA